MIHPAMDARAPNDPRRERASSLSCFSRAARILYSLTTVLKRKERETDFLFSKTMQTAPENWPAKTLNGYKLDLFGIYRQVVARGGWGEDEITCKRKINWSREIFPKLANFTSTHKATSVGHDLITSYKNYLHSYERKYADVDCNTDESKERELVNSIQRNTPRAGVTGTRSHPSSSGSCNAGRSRPQRARPCH